jgi:hypothetical protein
VTGALTSAGVWLIETGRDVIRGLIEGIGDMATAVAEKAASVVGGAIDAARLSWELPHHQRYSRPSAITLARASSWV